jgi:hypothetical protein
MANRLRGWQVRLRIVTTARQMALRWLVYRAPLRYVPRRCERTEPGMTGFEKGFGCRPGASGWTGIRGPASESLRRTNPRESGERLAVYGDFTW